MSLTVPFRIHELDFVVSQCEGNKSICSNGSNFFFLKRLWNLVREDMVIMFDPFYCFASLPRSFASYFVTLIPKVNSPTQLDDFRPISLVELLYKLVAKVLVATPEPVMEKPIAHNQSTFLKRRMFVDEVWLLMM